MALHLKPGIPELRKRAAEAEAKLKPFYDTIENGVVDVADPSLNDRRAEPATVRDQAQADAERATAAVKPLRPGHYAGQLAAVRAGPAARASERI